MIGWFIAGYVVRAVTHHCEASWESPQWRQHGFRSEAEYIQYGRELARQQARAINMGSFTGLEWLKEKR